MTKRNILMYDAAKDLIKEKKEITNDFTRQLILSLTSKIFYTAYRCKIGKTGIFAFNEDKQFGLPSIKVYTYTSVLQDSRYIIVIDNFKENPFIIFWDGKFDDPSKKKKSKIYLNIPNFNVTNDLDEFVLFEVSLVEVLQLTEREFAESETSKMEREKNES